MAGEYILEALASHLKASASRDLDQEHTIYADEAIRGCPQSAELILERHYLQSLRGHHPGNQSGFEVKRISAAANLWISEYTIIDQERPYLTVRMMEFQAGNVVHGTQYFAEPFPAPAWRREFVPSMP